MDTRSASKWIFLNSIWCDTELLGCRERDTDRTAICAT